MSLLLLLLTAQTPAPEGTEYLVLVHDSLADAVRPLADWKRQKGYRTAVVRLSQVAASPDPEAIRAFIRKTRPRYVLLVGDAPLLPPQSVKRQRRISTDLYYGCLDDGDDWHPDAYVGRLPADTPDECAVMVRKILAYERTPDVGACRKALLAAEFADHDDDGYENEKFTETAVAARSYLGALGVSSRTAFQRKPSSTALPLRHARAHTGEWDLRWAGGEVIKGTWGTTLHPDGLPYVAPLELLSDDAFRRRMSEALAEGVGIVQFNLHGKPKETVFPRHGAEDVRALTNGERLPLVMYFACSTGMFTAEDCLAEEWMKNPRGGAMGVIAASHGSWGGYSEWVSFGIWEGLAGGFFAHLSGQAGYKTIACKGNPHGPTRRLGPLLAYGKEVLFELYREETQREWLTRETFELYNLLGDPELELRLGEQLPLEAVVEGSTLAVRRGGKPLAGARVGLSSPSRVRCATTDAAGRARLDLSGEARWTLTVTAPDSLPFQRDLP